MKYFKLSVLTVVFIIPAFINLSNAQENEYNRFEWEVIKVGYSNTQDIPSVRSGMTFGSEIRYFTSSSLSIGLATDFHLYLSNISDDNFDFNYLAEGCLTTDYYTQWRNNKCAFVGLSVGSAATNTIFFEEGEEIDRLEERESFVLGVRAGFEYKKLRFTLKKTFAGDINIPDVLSLTIGFNFLRFR